MLSPEEQDAWIEAESTKIYRVLTPPPPERVSVLKEGHAILKGDYGWGAPLVYPPERVGEFVHLVGFDDDFKAIWRAAFLINEVAFATRKPDLMTFTERRNPYAVQKPQA